MIIDENCQEEQCLGELPQKVINLLGLDLVSPTVTISPGAIKHIKEEHARDFAQYFDRLHEIIECPDYAGCYQSSEKFELIKVFEDHVLIGLKIKNSRAVVSSFYKVNWVKVDTRVKRGRLKKVE